MVTRSGARAGVGSRTAVKTRAKWALGGYTRKIRNRIGGESGNGDTGGSDCGSGDKVGAWKGVRAEMQTRRGAKGERRNEGESGEMVVAREWAGVGDLGGSECDDRSGDRSRSE
ncbi:hypothetical protein PoB_005005700 [Plakobranchus ocellatus]|uniref:Uncharacterized protein n=1 Tax=Plakobranchus ocellatus TaxID=259542 RepID=A0AAV4BWV6_9GAST|nr:hypothetical protein PoB_005005700 [Plakobranchus ocellatus]